jgi:hypothetical protein
MRIAVYGAMLLEIGIFGPSGYGLSPVWLGFGRQGRDVAAPWVLDVACLGILEEGS